MQRPNMVLTFSLSFVIALSISLASGAARQAKPAPAWQGTIVSENGLEVVKNPAEPQFGTLALDLAEDLSLESETDKNLSFYRIRSVRVDRDGNIFVLDAGNFRIQVFDRNGRFVRSIGRQGQGPGEFQFPARMGLESRSAHLFVQDVMARSLKEFDENGVFHKSVLVPVIEDFVPLEAGGLLAVVIESDEKELTAHHAFCRIEADGKVSNTFGRYVYNLHMGHEGGGTFAYTTGYEFSAFVSRIDAGSLVFGYSKDYALTIVDTEGKPVRRFEKAGPKPAFTPVELKSFGRREVPEQKPYFFALLTDSEGRTYVRREVLEGVRGRGPVDLKPVEMEVFGRDGRYLFKTVLPPNTGQIENGLLYAFTFDEDTGKETVNRFRIKNWGDLPIAGK